ncbi:PucR family transcriptional regulator [Lederbergia lenta]|uniref:PucR family transcriptional regulator n=1 Tax=Lederbergia lenta TaxID=1467 RepID=UPI00203BFCA5|nr:PucR family transcriptional regulator ligand-binding domain-containing protein [Lederbergia lenta]
MKSYITVKDILGRKHFENVEVIAGVEGLSRLVKWVHVVEVTNIRDLLNGNELILSTGIAWKEKEGNFVYLLEQLIDSQAAGLCIEIGTYTSLIPQEMIDIANEAQFPIILFHQEVPFVKITQDIHTLLINHQYEMISNLERYSQALNKELLTFEHHHEILKCIQQYLQVQVIIVFSNEETQFIPEIIGHRRKTLLNLIARNNDTMPNSLTHTSRSIAKIPIHLLGENYAELIIMSDERTLTEYDQLILDRTATALAQFLLRNLYVEEKRRVEETEWLNGWLENEKSEESINEYLAYHTPHIKPKGALVCIYKLDTLAKMTNVDLTYFKLYFRSIFEQQGFSLFAIEKRNTLVFILINERMAVPWKERIEEGIHRLKSSESPMVNHTFNQLIGIGKYEKNLTSLYKSYETALETIRIQEKLPNRSDCHFYDDLHIFRFIYLLNQQLNLNEIVYEYLESIIHYDKKYNGKLMETLKTYLSCNGSKQETAKRLFIVRQTLYHRIQKLEKLLGEDFMQPEKRLVIEMMILSHEFLTSSKQTEELDLEAF